MVLASMPQFFRDNTTTGLGYREMVRRDSSASNEDSPS